MDEWSPIVSEFESAEQEASYLAWLRDKVAASLADQSPVIPHDEAMASVRAVIARRAAQADEC